MYIFQANLEMKRLTLKKLDLFYHKWYSDTLLPHVFIRLSVDRHTWPLEQATGTTVGSEQLEPAGQIVQVILPVVSA